MVTDNVVGDPLQTTDGDADGVILGFEFTTTPCIKLAVQPCTEVPVTVYTDVPIALAEARIEFPVTLPGCQL